MKKLKLVIVMDLDVSDEEANEIAQKNRAGETGLAAMVEAECFRYHRRVLHNVVGTLKDNPETAEAE